MSAIHRIEEIDIDKAQEVLDAFGGNALAALWSVIADAEFCATSSAARWCVERYRSYRKYSLAFLGREEAVCRARFAISQQLPRNRW